MLHSYHEVFQTFPAYRKGNGSPPVTSHVDCSSEFLGRPGSQRKPKLKSQLVSQTINARSDGEKGLSLLPLVWVGGPLSVWRTRSNNGTGWSPRQRYPASRCSICLGWSWSSFHCPSWPRSKSSHVNTLSFMTYDCREHFVSQLHQASILLIGVTRNSPRQGWPSAH